MKPELKKDQIDESTGYGRKRIRWFGSCKVLA
jgi:hypothetical protein